VVLAYGTVRASERESERALSKSGCKQAAECDVYNCWLDILRMTARGLHVSTAVARERE
jgi:hypothetical protein